MTVALLGGLVSVVGACGTGNPRPSSGPAPVPGRVADAVPWHEQGPTGSARHVFTDNLPPLQTAAWVAVPVATLWDQPGFARPIDAPVVQRDPDVSQWLASMDFSSKVGLDYIMTTQALMDEPLTVIEVSGRWADVLVQGQTGSVYPDGVEGWIPSSQITYQSPPTTALHATVTAPLADTGGIDLSYGTRLPVVSSDPGSYVVATPYGPRSLAATDATTSTLAPSGQAVLQEAEKFLGLPYLWAGTSGYGFDCSGLTYAVYRQFGITLARDAGDQMQQGRPVTKDQLQPGDLMFFATGGDVHHVGIYAGNGMMLDAPQTGGQVELIRIWSSGLAIQYAGSRRYIQ